MADNAAPDRAAAAALERRYLIGMASLMLIDLAITGIFLIISEHLEAAARAALLNVLILGVVNALGARLIFRPIRRAMAGNGDMAAATRRIRALPRLSALWVAALTMAYIAAAFGDGVLTDDAMMATIPDAVVIAATLWYTAVYIVLYGGYVLLFSSDLAGRARAILGERMGVQMDALSGRYAVKLAGVFALVGGLPAALIAGDLTIFEPFRAAQGLSTEEAVLLDVLAASFAIGAALIFAVRGLTKPVARLADAMDRAARDEAHVLAAVASDDEIGRLTGRFNRMIVERRAAEQEVRWLAARDPLTGALNRNGFVSTVRSMEERDGLVVVVDVVDFQAINDGLGPRVGDAAIQAIHERLARAFPDRPVARLYGDIFALSACGAAAAVEATLTRVFETPFLVAGNSIRFFACHGAAPATPGAEPETLLQHAVMAMKDGKGSATNRLALYDDGLQKAAARRQEIALGLQNALRRDELIAYYQPIVSMETLKPVGFEALMRWNNNGRMESPAEFIPVAEASGLIIDLGDWLIRRVVADLKTFTKTLPGAYVAVNFSGRQIEDGGATETIREELANAGLPVSAASVEVTESLAMDEGAFPVEAYLRRLREAGFHISLDDFGTGHSSLVRLKDMPVSQIKIDRSFITDMETVPRKLAIVRNLMGLALDLDLDVVAEGVENEAQIKLLRELGCPKGQGYHFGKPMPFDAAVSFLRGPESAVTTAR